MSVTRIVLASLSLTGIALTLVPGSSAACAAGFCTDVRGDNVCLVRSDGYSYCAGVNGVCQGTDFAGGGWAYSCVVQVGGPECAIAVVTQYSSSGQNSELLCLG